MVTQFWSKYTHSVTLLLSEPLLWVNSEGGSKHLEDVFLNATHALKFLCDTGVMKYFKMVFQDLFSSLFWQGKKNNKQQFVKLLE